MKRNPRCAEGEVKRKIEKRREIGSEPLRTGENISRKRTQGTQKGRSGGEELQIVEGRLQIGMNPRDAEARR